MITPIKSDDSFGKYKYNTIYNRENTNCCTKNKPLHFLTDTEPNHNKISLTYENTD